MNFIIDDAAVWTPFGRGKPVQVRVTAATLAKPFRYDVELAHGQNAGQVFRNVEAGHLAPVAAPAWRERSPLRAVYPTKGLRALIGSRV